MKGIIEFGTVLVVVKGQPIGLADGVTAVIDEATPLEISDLVNADTIELRVRDPKETKFTPAGESDEHPY